MPNRPVLPDATVVHPADRRKGPGTVDPAEGLHRRGVAHGRNHPLQDPSARLPPPQGPEVQAQKKIKQTDAIFTRLHHRHAQAAEADNVLRLSLDTKATVKIGLFSRGGHNWVEVKGLDHDFKPEATLSPFGILVQRYQDLFLYFARSRITSDFIVAMLEHWWEGVRRRFPRIDTLLLNQDNGPENHSRRTQFL